MIWFFVIRFNPLFTRYNASCIAKELGIQKTFDYGVVIFGKWTKRLLGGWVKIIDPGAKQLNTYKLVLLADSPWIRLAACTAVVER